MNPQSLAVDLLEGDTFQITETDKWGHGALVWDHDLARLSSHANLQTEVADAINDRECDENPIENIQDSTRRRLFVEADDDSDLPTGMVYCAPHTSHKILCIDTVAGSAYLVGEDLRHLEMEEKNSHGANEPLRIRVNNLWDTEVQGWTEEDDEIDVNKCWTIILRDKELPKLLGRSDIEIGTGLLRMMKEMRALDQYKKNGRISQKEFHRIYDFDVIATAESRLLKSHVQSMWASYKKEKDKDDEIERVQYVFAIIKIRAPLFIHLMRSFSCFISTCCRCWRLILDDSKLAKLIGKCSEQRGKEILNKMKEMRALDALKPDGRISADEFKRLCDPEIIAAAEQTLLMHKVHRLWDSLKKDEDGQIERDM